jgi:hypothetical protein
MTPSGTRVRLSVYQQSTVELWQAAAADLASGMEHNNPLIQASVHAVLAWLRTEATEPLALLELFGRRSGPLAAQLRLIGSLLLDPSKPALPPGPRQCWAVAKAAYYVRWLELAPTSTTSA